MTDARCPTESYGADLLRVYLEQATACALNGCVPCAQEVIALREALERREREVETRDRRSSVPLRRTP